MNDYTYNDDDSAMVRWAENFTSRIGDGSGDHEQAYLDVLQLLMQINGQGSLLDIGCGFGRVTAMAQAHMAEVVALEPDKSRCDYTHQRLHSPPRVQVLNLTTSELIDQYPRRQFDICVLGMVVQHISTDACRALFADLAQLTRPGGVAVVATTHAPAAISGFTLSQEPGQRIDEHAFNYYADHPDQQHKGLPVRRFSREQLLQQVPAGFSVAYWSQFSYYRPDRVGWFAHNQQVPEQLLLDVGNSQFMVLHKHPSEN